MNTSLSVIELIGQILGHFVWQGTLIAVLLGLCLTMLRKASANARYAVLCFGMLAMIGAPLATAFRIHSASLHTETSAMADDESGIVSAPGNMLNFEGSDPLAILPSSKRPWPVTSFLVGLWFVGVLALAIRRWAHWRSAWRLALPSQLEPVPDRFLVMLGELKGKLGMRAHVLLTYSRRVQVPCVIGAWQPRILLPLSILTTLDESQLKAILAHELMHIKRHDYLVNLLQTVIETVLFYHPAVWWVGRRLRIEREHCCDDGALKLCENPAVYSKALLKLEEARASEPALALSARGFLANRIKRVLQPAPQSGRLVPGVSTSILVVLAVGIGICFLPRESSQAEQEEGLAQLEEAAAADTPVVRLRQLAEQLKGIRGSLQNTAPSAQEDPLQKFLDQPEIDDAGKGELHTFNVILRRAHDFTDEVPNSDQKWCLKIDSPVDGLDGGFCFISKQTELGRGVDSQYKWLLTHFPTVELRWEEDPDHRGKPYVHLVGISSDAWRKADLDTEKPGVLLLEGGRSPDRRALERQKPIELMAQFRSALTQLESLEGAELLQKSNALGINDRSLQSLVPLYQEHMLERERLLALGLGKQHPKLKAIEGQMERVGELIQKASHSVKETLRTKLSMAERAAKISEVASSEPESTDDGDIKTVVEELDTLVQEVIVLANRLPQADKPAQATLSQDYQEAQLERQYLLDSGLGPNHPRVKAATVRVKMLKSFAEESQSP